MLISNLRPFSLPYCSEVYGAIALLFESIYSQCSNFDQPQKLSSRGNNSNSSPLCFMHPKLLNSCHISCQLDMDDSRLSCIHILASCSNVGATAFIRSVSFPTSDQSKRNERHCYKVVDCTGNRM